MLASWAVPKGPSTNPKDKRMARRTEDHPMKYATFEGAIPKGEYGAGGVIECDRGTYTNEARHGMTEGLESGRLSFTLRGEKLRGGYALTRIREGDDETWLLVKHRDEDADARGGRGTQLPHSRVAGCRCGAPTASPSRAVNSLVLASRRA